MSQVALWKPTLLAANAAVFKEREGSSQQSRWVVSWNIDSGPSQRFFETRVEAVEFRNRLLTNAEPARPSNTTLSANAIRAWLPVGRVLSPSRDEGLYQRLPWKQYWPAGFEDSRMQGPDLERLDPPFQFSHVDAEFSFSPLCHNDQHPVRQRPLKFQRLDRLAFQPEVELLNCSQDHRHGFRMDGREKSAIGNAITATCSVADLARI